MRVQHYRNVPESEVAMEGAAGCRVRSLVGKSDAAPNFSMRAFEVAPGGYTPKHFHPYEHEVFVLEGRGEVLDGDTPRPLSTGDIVYVAPDDIHQFRNTGNGPLRFLCLIPNSAANAKVTAIPECGVDARCM